MTRRGDEEGESLAPSQTSTLRTAPRFEAQSALSRRKRGPRTSQTALRARRGGRDGRPRADQLSSDARFLSRALATRLRTVATAIDAMITPSETQLLMSGAHSMC